MQKNPLRQKRIFVGFNSAGSAGIYAYTRILRRRGYQIDFYGIGKVAFNMPVDFLLDFSGIKLFSLGKRILFFFKIMNHYDIWHLNFLECFFFYPLNLAILKIFGKKIVLTCRGADVRDTLDFLPKELSSKISDENLPEFYKRQLKKRSFWKRFKQNFRKKVFVYFSDKVILTGPFLASAVYRYDKIIPYGREINELKKYKKNTKNIKIIHIPSEPVVKGTEIIEKSFKNLQKKYSLRGKAGKKIEFKILAKIPREELLKEMADADIVIDQLLVGWYGGQAVEAMAMGKIVVSFLSPPYLALVEYGNEIPIWNSNPWNFQNDLERLIEIFPVIQKDWSEKSVKFVSKYHSANRIARMYLDVYKELYE